MKLDKIKIEKSRKKRRKNFYNEEKIEFSFVEFFLLFN